MQITSKDITLEETVREFHKTTTDVSVALTTLFRLASDIEALARGSCELCCRQLTDKKCTNNQCELYGVKV